MPAFDIQRCTYSAMHWLGFNFSKKVCSTFDLNKEQISRPCWIRQCFGSWVLMHVGVTSCSVICMSLTKIWQPISLDTRWLDWCGLRIYHPAGESWSSFSVNVPVKTQTSSPRGCVCSVNGVCGENSTTLVARFFCTNSVKHHTIDLTAWRFDPMVILRSDDNRFWKISMKMHNTIHVCKFKEKINVTFSTTLYEFKI